MMYYRVAIQVDPPARWQWKSTPLRSLNTLLQWLQFYRAFSKDRLRIFSSPSCEQMNEQLARENQGLLSTSVLAAQFLLERKICSEVPLASSERQEGSYRRKASTAVLIQASLNQSSRAVPSAERKGLNPLENRRLELESGAGGDHDLPYRFSSPLSLPQALAWMRLLAKVRYGELQP